MNELAAAADRLRSLHHGEQPLILPNAWDAASAQAVERAGAAAVATTSSGVAEALGYPDGEAIPPAEMFAAVARIAAAVSVPVSADLEAGYGLSADELVTRLLETGAVGLNLEDTDRGSDPSRLTDVDAAAEFMRASSIHRVLVMQDRQLLGVVSTRDISDAVADRRLTTRTYVFGAPRHL